MALTEGNGNDMIMPVTPMGGYGGGSGMGWGGSDGWWIILLFLFAFGNGGWGGYGNGGGSMGAEVQRGFDQSAVMSGVSGIQSGISGLSTQLCNGFAQAEIAENSRQMANMNQMFGLSQQIAQGSCDNRLATCQTQNLVQSEGAATRLAIQNQTQAIIDKLCQLELDGLKQDNANLRTQLNMANLAASQTAQTAQILQGQTAEVDALYNRLKNCPVPAQPVYGSQPIFTCGGNGGCGCGA